MVIEFKWITYSLIALKGSSLALDICSNGCRSESSGSSSNFIHTTDRKIIKQFSNKEILPLYRLNWKLTSPSPTTSTESTLQSLKYFMTFFEEKTNQVSKNWAALVKKVFEPNKRKSKFQVVREIIFSLLRACK